MYSLVLLLNIAFLGLACCFVLLFVAFLVVVIVILLNEVVVVDRWTLMLYYSCCCYVHVLLFWSLDVLFLWFDCYSLVVMWFGTVDIVVVLKKFVLDGKGTLVKCLSLV